MIMLSLLRRIWGWWQHRLLKRDVAWTEKYIPSDTWTENGRSFKRFADGLVGEDITDLDVTDIEELRRVYGKSPFLDDDRLQTWAKEARESKLHEDWVRGRLREIDALPKPEVENTGYIPVTGPKAGTSPKTGVVMPPVIQDLTTKEWVDLRLEQAYGKGNLPRPMAPGQAGFSMRYLTGLRNRAERRDASLSAYDLAILRSRGLV